MSSLRKWMLFSFWFTLVGLTWTIILPRLSELPDIQQHIARMEQKGIVVEAMFYTELDWQPPPGASWR